MGSVYQDRKGLRLRRQPHPATCVIAPVNVGVNTEEREKKNHKRKLKSLESLRFSPEINTQRNEF